MTPKPIECPGCHQPRHHSMFLDEERRFSRFCSVCRSKATTGDQTPHARKASGMIDTREVRRLLEEQRREEAEADTLPPPPAEEKEKT